MNKTATLRFARMLKMFTILAEEKSTSDKLKVMRNGLEKVMEFVNTEGTAIEDKNIDDLDVLFYKWDVALQSIIKDETAENNDRITARHLSDDLGKNKVRLEALKKRKLEPAPSPVPVPGITSSFRMRITARLQS